jgi:zinc/manganese transport system substrate-binding protein
MKKITFGMLIINLIAFIVLSIYPKMTLSSKANESTKLREPFFNIMTSNKSVYLMVNELVKDKHNVEYLAKDQEEIKSFTFDEDVINNISNMDLFIYTGKNFEPWATDLISELKKDKVSVVDISRGTKVLTVEDGNENPYYWMDFENYKIALFNIKNELQAYDPNNKEYYETNYNDVIKGFEEAYLDKLTVLKNLESTDFYYADYSLEYFSKYINSKVQALDNNKIDKLIKSKAHNKIVLYSEDKQIDKYRETLELNNVHLIKVKYYSEDKDYVHTLEEAIDELFKSLNLTLGTKKLE